MIRWVGGRERVGVGCTFRVVGRKKDGVGRGVILGMGLVA